MTDSWQSLNLKSLAETLKNSIRNQGGFSPSAVKSMSLSKSERLTDQILLALQGGGKNGQEIIGAVFEAIKIKPQAGDVYPLLETLLDQQLVAVKMVKDRKVYSLTKAGKDKAAGIKVGDAQGDEATEMSWAWPTWIDLRGDVPRAFARLGRVALDSVGSGNQAQQKEIAALLDETRRQVHKILADQ